MKYRITIEKQKEPEPNEKYTSCEELYQQIVEDLDINMLVAGINTTRIEMRIN